MSATGCQRYNLATSKADYVLSKFMFPVVFAIAVAVVSYTMHTVLRRKDRNVGRHSLIVLGIIEILMFLTCVPHALASYEAFYSSEPFRRFYFESLIQQVAITNVLSAADSFLTVLICTEFYLFAKDAPAKKMFASPRRQFLIYGLIAVATFLITLPTFLQNTMETFTVCDGAVMRYRIKHNLELSTVQLSQFVHGLTVIVLPSFVIFFLNRRLVNCVGYQTLPTHEAKELMGSEQAENNSLRRLRLCINLLTFAYILPHLVSMVPFVLEHTQSSMSRHALATVVPLSSMLLLIGKIATYYFLNKVSFGLANSGIVTVY